MDFNDQTLLDNLSLLNQLCKDKISDELIKIYFNKIKVNISTIIFDEMQNNNHNINMIFETYVNDRCKNLNISKNDARNIILYNYEFISNIDRDYINITINNQFLYRNWCYYDMKFDFNHYKYQTIIEKLIEPCDRDKVIIAGGCFTSYICDDRKYKELVTYLKEIQDIDIYVCAAFKKYKTKWEHEKIKYSNI